LGKVSRLEFDLALTDIYNNDLNEVIVEDNKYNTFESSYKLKPINNDLNQTNSTQFATELKQTEQKSKSFIETFDDKKKLDFESTTKDSNVEFRRSHTPDIVKKDKD